ncbi:bacteriocin immunity protein [Lactobacillus intestinalis]|uniref:bacteriocin immunity protein n=1 Tax=Lactobacillus intestinalis TaxID=151781 RepID=UPI00260EBF57|nr:bacteriocin immunity protein [Lactobacillus intestinalis]
MFFKKSNKEALTFEEALKRIIENPTVKKNSELIQVFQSAIEKVDKQQSIQSIASNLSLKLKSNFDEKELPPSVVKFQLKLERYAAIAANGIVIGIFDWL